MSDNDIIRNRDIIMVGQQPWDVEIGSNSKNIAFEFSRHNRVLYINPPLDRVTAIKYKNVPGIKTRIDIIHKRSEGLIKIKQNLWNYYPDTLIGSINWIRNKHIHTLLNKINNKRFARSIEKAIQALGFKNYILFNDNDIFRCFYLKELLKPKLSVYYSRDYLLTVDYWKLHGKRMEPKLIAKSDICVANSVYLANYCKKYNKNSFYVGQGCDIDEFTNYKGKIADDIAHIKKPVIGYVGALQNIRLDIELLKYIALKKTGYNIVLIGSEDKEFKASDLHHIKNIFFLGPKAADSMPAYIKAFDVCLNPQVINQVTIGNYPRKIDEYLAMGKPVVATQTEAMSIFKDHTYLGNSKKDYLLLIDRALKEDSAQLQKQRVQFAAAHTWENSVKEIYKAIQGFRNEYMGLKGKAILILSNMRFNSPIEATSLFLARHLAENNLVYYIEYPNTFKDYFKKRNSEYFSKRKGSFFNPDNAVMDTEILNLKKVTLPIVASINFLPEGKIFRAVLKINERIIVKGLKAILKKKGIKDFVFINSFNFHYPGIGTALKPELKIYQCIDPMITPYDLNHGFVSEHLLVKESDMVICTSKALFNEKKIINKNTYLVPNAADILHSSKALDKKLSVHSKLKKIAKPIIGYFGSIERRIDYELMKNVITDNPDKSFVFAGPVIKEHIPGWFFDTPNVYLCGQISYDEMPQMLKGFDIAIIPFKKDEVSATIFPLKLFEYLGAGKPVIMTDFNPDLKEYTHGAVKFCNDAAAFTKALNDILTHDDITQQAERLSVAQQNTWEIRSKQIAGLIDKALKPEN